MAPSLSASVKVDESPWRLSVEGGCFGKAISLDIRNSPSNFLCKNKVTA